MMTFHPIAEHRFVLPKNSDISDSYDEIVSFSYPVPKDYSIQDVKVAMRACKANMQANILGRPCSAYDCTGKHFTAGVEVIHKCIHAGFVTYIFKHSISIDI